MNKILGFKTSGVLFFFSIHTDNMIISCERKKTAFFPVMLRINYIQTVLYYVIGR